MKLEEKLNSSADFEMYQVEEHGGRKVIHYNGFIWMRDEPELNDGGEECRWSIDEGTWCGLGGRGTEVAYVDAIEGSVLDFVMRQFEGVQQYGGLITDEERAEYIESWGGEYLPMDDVTADTPCGCYWF